MIYNNGMPCCSECRYGKIIRSKNGFKYVCKLKTEKEVRWCLANGRKSYIPANKEERI